MLLLCSAIVLSGRSQTPYRVSIDAIPWLIFPDAAAVLNEHRPADCDIYHAIDYSVDSERGVAQLDLQNPHDSWTRDFRYVSEAGGPMILEYAALGNAENAQLSDAVAAYLPLFGINYGDKVNGLEILHGQSVKPRKRSLYSSIDQALTIDNTLEADDYILHWTTSSIELAILIDTATATYAYTLTLWFEEGKVQVLILRRQR